MSIRTYVQESEQSQKLIKLKEQSSTNEFLKKSVEANYESWQLIVKQGKSDVVEEEKKLNNKMDAVWEKTTSFIAESTKFHEENGIMSSWWKDQVSNAAKTNGNYPVENAMLNNRLELIKEVQQLKIDISVEKNSLKICQKRQSGIEKELAASEERISELKIQEQDLREQPFRPAFLELKEKIQKGKNMCLQLRSLIISHGHGNQFLETDTEKIMPISLPYINSTLSEPFSSFTPSSALFNAAGGSTVDNKMQQRHTTMNPKQFKMRKRTTVTVQRQYQRIDEVRNIDRCQLGPDYLPSEQNATDVTHS